MPRYCVYVNIIFICMYAHVWFSVERKESNMYTSNNIMIPEYQPIRKSDSEVFTIWFHNIPFWFLHHFEIQLIWDNFVGWWMTKLQIHTKQHRPSVPQSSVTIPLYHTSKVITVSKQWSIIHTCIWWGQPYTYLHTYIMQFWTWLNVRTHHQIWLV